MLKFKLSFFFNFLLFLCVSLNCVCVFGEVRFRSSSDSPEIRVEIVTDSLYMRSINESDFEMYNELMGNSITMEKYATGVRKSDVIKFRVNQFDRFWKQGNPFSGFAVFLREKDLKDEGIFVGHIALDEGDDIPEEAELAYILDHRFWRKRLGTEMAKAIMHEYVPELVKRNYKLRDSTVFKRVVATARPDNPGSVKILENLGFELVKEFEKFGKLRKLYSKSVDQD